MCALGTVFGFLLLDYVLFQPVTLEIYEVAITFLASWLLTGRLFDYFTVLSTEEDEDEQN